MNWRVDCTPARLVGEERQGDGAHARGRWTMHWVVTCGGGRSLRPLLKSGKMSARLPLWPGSHDSWPMGGRGLLPRGGFA